MCSLKSKLLGFEAIYQVKKGETEIFRIEIHSEGKCICYSMQNLPLSYKLPITYAAAFLHPIRNPKCAQIIMCVMGEKRLQGNFHFSVGIVCILFTRKNNNTHNLYWLQPIFISCVYYSQGRCYSRFQFFYDSEKVFRATPPKSHPFWTLTTH